MNGKVSISYDPRNKGKPHVVRWYGEFEPHTGKQRRYSKSFRVKVEAQQFAAEKTVEFRKGGKSLILCHAVSHDTRKRVALDFNEVFDQQPGLVMNAIPTAAPPPTLIVIEDFEPTVQSSQAIIANQPDICDVLRETLLLPVREFPPSPQANFICYIQMPYLMGDSMSETSLMNAVFRRFIVSFGKLQNS